MDFLIGRKATLRERALEIILERVLRSFSDLSVESDIMHRDFHKARMHLLRRMAWRNRAKRASVTDRKRGR